MPIYLCVIYCVFMHVCIFLTRFEQQVQEKEVLERKLYSGFVILINEKKAKIRALQDTVQQLQKTDDKHKGQWSAELLLFFGTSVLLL